MNGGASQSNQGLFHTGCVTPLCNSMGADAGNAHPVVQGRNASQRSVFQARIVLLQKVEIMSKENIHNDAKTSFIMRSYV